MELHRIASFVFVALMGSSVVPHASATAQTAALGTSIEAIWRVQSFDFHYSSSSVAYSCEALQGKVAAILAAVGAHKSAIMIRCSTNLAKTAYARITLAAPAAATPENIRAATTFDSRAQLIAEIRNVQLPTATDIQRFPATWRTVSLRHDRQLRLEPGDCELLRRMSSQIFPRLSIRVKRRQLCIDGAVRRMPTLEVEALVADSPVPSAGSKD